MKYGGANQFKPVLKISNNKTYKIINSKGETQTVGKNNNNDGLTTYYLPESDDNGDQTLCVVLPDPNESYSFETSDGSSADISLTYGDKYYSISTDSAAQIKTSPSGNIDIVKNNGKFEIEVADDTKKDDPYNSYTISGSTSGDIHTEITDSGFKASGVSNGEFIAEGNNETIEKKIDQESTIDSSQTETIIKSKQNSPKNLVGDILSVAHVHN